jgi:hypothetical protein
MGYLAGGASMNWKYDMGTIQKLLTLYQMCYQLVWGLNKFSYMKIRRAG